MIVYFRHMLPGYSFRLIRPGKSNRFRLAGPCPDGRLRAEPRLDEWPPGYFSVCVLVEPRKLPWAAKTILNFPLRVPPGSTDKLPPLALVAFDAPR